MRFLWETFFGKILMTFLISMVPVLELRGAIPIATAHGLDFRIAIPVAIIGNLVPVPFIIIFIRKIFVWIRKKIPRLGAVPVGVLCGLCTFCVQLLRDLYHSL